MTPEEAILWQELRNNKLNGLHFRRQQIIGSLIADFFCNDAGVVIEIDGPIHLGTREYDAQRDLAFEERGLEVLHFTNEQVQLRLRDVLDRIQVACGETVPRLTSRSSG